GARAECGHGLHAALGHPAGRLGALQVLQPPVRVVRHVHLVHVSESAGWRSAGRWIRRTPVIAASPAAIAWPTVAINREASAIPYAVPNGTPNPTSAIAIRNSRTPIPDGAITTTVL